MLIDAGNVVSIAEGAPSEIITEQSLSMNDMMKILSESRNSARKNAKSDGIDPNLWDEPLGLLRSSKGWIAISTAGPEQKALYTYGAGGIGSLIFFDLLVNGEDFQENWMTFLDEYRNRLQAQAVKYNKKVQSPVWVGKVNGKDL